jgi:hypothetical protein
VDHLINRLKIDARKTSLNRLTKHVAYVLGDEAPTAPQLWVYKDSFLPARVRFTENQSAWDVRFLDFGAPATGEWFPRVIEVYQGGEPVLRFTALRANAHARVDDALF